MKTDQMTIAAGAIVHPVEYPVSENEIATARAKYGAISFDTPEGYEEGRLAIAHLRTARTSIEKRRTELNADAIAYKRKVDDIAKRLTAMVSEIEDPLKERKAAVDDAKERARRDAEDAARAEAEAKAKAEREAEEARIADERRKLEAQQAVFAEAQRRADEERRVADETARAERERVEKEQRAAQAKLDADRAELEAQQRAIREKEEAAARAVKEREEAARKEQEAKEQAERDRIAAEQRAIEEAARAAAEAARLERLRPDIEKIQAWVGEIREFANKAPVLESDDARTAVDWAHKRFHAVAFEIEKRFAPKGGI